MNQPQPQPAEPHTARAMQIYGWVVCLYPAAHRHAFGEQMLLAFRDHYQDAVQGEGEPEGQFWLGVVAELGYLSVAHQETGWA